MPHNELPTVKLKKLKSSIWFVNAISCNAVDRMAGTIPVSFQVHTFGNLGVC